MFDLARDINRARDADSDERHGLASLLRYLGGIIGLLQANPEEYLKSRIGTRSALSDAAIEELIELRLQARARKDWAEADRIRDQLSDAGIVIEDGADGSRWRRE